MQKVAGSDKYFFISSLKPMPAAIFSPPALWQEQTCRFQDDTESILSDFLDALYHSAAVVCTELFGIKDLHISESYFYLF